MITCRQLTEINQLNILMKDCGLLREAMSSDKSVRNVYNITRCINSIELYSYLYKHYDKISTLFKTDSSGFMNMYSAQKLYYKLVDDMYNNQLTPKQAIDELYRIRKAADYRGEWG